MSSRGWQGDVGCPFCGEPETVNHLFLQCSFARIIWNWIAEYNNFDFNIGTMEELWFIDSLIPLKDRLLLELVRGAVLWTLWLTRNKLCFQGIRTKPRAVGAQIISLAKFWVTSKDSGSILKLSLVLSTDVLHIPILCYDLIEQEEAIDGTTQERRALLLTNGFDLRED